MGMSMASVVVSVSYAMSHRKGTEAAMPMNAQKHAEWLEQAVHWYVRRGFPTIVAATGYPGILDVETSSESRERDALWRILRQGVPILGTVHNPGHQVGAALCVRLGLEYAHCCGYDYLIHTAEDILPVPGKITEMLLALEDGYEYAGEAWGEAQDELNAQFFACQAAALVGAWDACRVTGHGHIECYLRDLLAGKPQALLTGTYQHTHDYEQWREWLIQQGDA